MTDIFDALHQKRSKQQNIDDEVTAAPSSTKSSRPKIHESRPVSPLPPMPAQTSSPNAPPTYQSLRDIHHETLEEAPKVKTMFWLRLGLALIGIGVAIIGIFTDLIGPLAMWSAVGAVLILIIPDLILKFILKDR